MLSCPICFSPVREGSSRCGCGRLQVDSGVGVQTLIRFVPHPSRGSNLPILICRGDGSSPVLVSVAPHKFMPNRFRAVGRFPLSGARGMSAVEALVGYVLALSVLSS